MARAAADRISSIFGAEPGWRWMRRGGVSCLPTSVPEFSMVSRSTRGHCMRRQDFTGRVTRTVVPQIYSPPSCASSATRSSSKATGFSCNHSKPARGARCFKCLGGIRRSAKPHPAETEGAFFGSATGDERDVARGVWMGRLIGAGLGLAGVSAVISAAVGVSVTIKEGTTAYEDYREMFDRSGLESRWGHQVVFVDVRFAVLRAAERICAEARAPMR
jgi:hypothetical protein